MVLDVNFLNTQHYKVCIKGKVGQPRKRSSAPLTIEKGVFGSSSTTASQFYLLTYMYIYIYIYIERERERVIEI